MSELFLEIDGNIGFLNDVGNDIVWGQVGYGDAPDEVWADWKAEFEELGDGHHTDGDIYQGSTLMTVIRRKSDGALFGFAYWESGGKHGERWPEANGDELGFPTEYDWEEGVTEDRVWWVFQPVVEHTIPAYKFAEKS